ncbi:MAG: hypothetical protein ACLSES_00675 [Christensenellales bacterium]
MKNKEQEIYNFICGITDEQATELVKAIVSGAFEAAPSPDRLEPPSEHEKAPL